MAQHIESYEDLRGALRAGRLKGIIGIDGPMKAGKTPLAEKLAAELGAAVVHFDDFLPKNDNRYTYVPKLELSRMRTALEELTDAEVLVFLDGICLLEVCARLKIQCDVLIYVLPKDDIALENDFYRDDLTLEELLATIPSGGPGDIDREIATYTRRYRPHEKADFAFRWG